MIGHAVSINLHQFIREHFPGCRVRCVETFTMLCKPHYRKTLNCTKCYSIINGRERLYWTKKLRSLWVIQFISLLTYWHLTWKIKTLGLAGLVLMGTKSARQIRRHFRSPLWTLEFLQFCVGYLFIFLLLTIWACEKNSLFFLYN